MGHPCAVGYNYAQTLQTIKIAGLYRFLGYKNGKNHRNLQKQQKIDIVSSDGSMSPKATKIDLSSFTPEQLIEMGRAAFRGE